MRNGNSCTLKSESRSYSSGYLSFFAFTTILVVWPCFGVWAENLKIKNKNNATENLSSTTTKGWTKGLLKLDDEHGFETDELLDLKHYDPYDMFSNGDKSGSYYATQLLEFPYPRRQLLSRDAYAATHDVSGTVQLYLAFLDARINVFGTSVKRTFTNSNDSTLSDPASTMTSKAHANTLKIKIASNSSAGSLRFDSVKLTYPYFIKIKLKETTCSPINVYRS